jgi:hypothetical protein
MNRVLHRLLAVAAFAVATAASAAAPGGDASRDELRAWFGELRTIGVRVNTVLPWQYSFEAANGKDLEALSVALVAAGYRIVALGPAAEGAQRLAVATNELHTPATLERRNEDLRRLAREHGGVRYLGASPTAP